MKNTRPSDHLSNYIPKVGWQDSCRNGILNNPIDQVAYPYIAAMHLLKAWTIIKAPRTQIAGHLFALNRQMESGNFGEMNSCNIFRIIDGKGLYEHYYSFGFYISVISP